MIPPPLAGDLWLLLAVYAVALPVSLARLPLLCPAVFVAVGAAGTLQLQDHGWPLPIAVAALAAAAGGLGWLVGWTGRAGAPAMALSTWAFGWFVQELWFDVTPLAGGATGVSGPDPERLAIPTWGVAWRLTSLEIGLAALPLVVVVAAAVHALAGDGIGTRLRFARSSPELVGALGGRLAADRRLAVAGTAAIAAVAGAGLAVATGAVSPDDTGPLLSVQLVLAALVAGSARWWGPPIGTAGLLALDALAAALPGGLDLTTRSALVTAVGFAAVLGVRRTVARRRVRPPLDPGPAGDLVRPQPTALPADSAAPQAAGALRAPVLTLNAVTVAFGRIPALDDVSLELLSGQVVGVVGPNGSGKTTLLRVAAGAQRPDAGRITVRGRPLPLDAGPERLVRLGVVRTLQAGGLVGDLTVRDHVRLGATTAASVSWWEARRLAVTPVARQVMAQRQAAADRALAAAGLQPVADRRLGDLDSGTRPFVAIAAALATGAAVLCLDEPAAGLDRPARERLAGLLRALAAAGYALAVVDHDLDLVASVAEEVVVLSAGRIVARGSPREIDLLGAARLATPR